MSNIKQTARELAKYGGGKDTILAHINAEEAALLAKLSGGKVNPHTGLPQFGWLQDWSSDFSLKHLNPIETLNDPHKALTQWATKGMQRTVGPIAAKFIPGFGTALSAAGSAWNAHEQSNPSSSNYKAPDSTPAVQATQAAAISTIPTGSNGSGSSVSGISGLFGGLLGGGSTAKPAAASTSNAQTAQLQQQIAQLKQQLDQHYGPGDDPQKLEDSQKIDQWYQAQLSKLAPTAPQEAPTPA